MPETERHAFIAFFFVYVHTPWHPSVCEKFSYLVLSSETSTVWGALLYLFEQASHAVQCNEQEKTSSKKKSTLFNIASQYIRIFLFWPTQTKYLIDEKIKSVAHLVASVNIICLPQNTMNCFLPPPPLLQLHCTTAVIAAAAAAAPAVLLFCSFCRAAPSILFFSFQTNFVREKGIIRLDNKYGTTQKSYRTNYVCMNIRVV